MYVQHDDDDEWQCLKYYKTFKPKLQWLSQCSVFRFTTRIQTLCIVFVADTLTH